MIFKHLFSGRKFTHDDEWWEIAHSEMVQGGFHREMIPHICSRIAFRPELSSFLRRVSSMGCKTSVVSAGLGCVVHEKLRDIDVLRGEAGFRGVFANELYFDETGVMTGAVDYTRTYA